MKKIIAAVSDEQMFELALKSDIDTIFYLTPNINTIAQLVERAHLKDKKIFIHMDMAEGIAKDSYGIEYVQKLSVDGIISTRSNIIKTAKKNDLATVQRFFSIDTHSISTIIETTASVYPDMIEIMPGVATKAIDKIKDKTDIPIIAGGLITTADEAELAIKNGASAVSTSIKELWNLY